MQFIKQKKTGQQKCNGETNMDKAEFFVKKQKVFTYN